MALGWLGHWVWPWGWLGALRAWGVGGGPCARMCRCVWKIFSTRPRASLKFSGRRIHRQFVSGDLHNCGRRAKLGMGRGDQPHGSLLPRRPAELMRPWEEKDGDEAACVRLDRGAGGAAGHKLPSRTFFTRVLALERCKELRSYTANFFFVVWC